MTPTCSELAELAHTSRLLLYEDAGSGSLIDLTDYGIEGEPVIRKSIDDGADIVTFSGDKLLRGPQAGLIVGRAELIEKMRQKPLYRALRADKLRLAALEATLESYAGGDSVPSLAMIALPADQILSRSQAFADRVNSREGNGISLDLIQEQSVVGGGAAPLSPLPTVLISLKHPLLTAEEIAARLRRAQPPVIARILDDRVALDLRTVAPVEEPEVENAIAALPS